MCRTRARASNRQPRPRAWPGPRSGAGPRGGGGSGCGGGAWRPWRPRLQLQRRAGAPRPGRRRVGAAAVAAAARAMYRSGARSSVSSHRPKESGGGGPRTGRSSGSSSGPARRTSPPPSGSSSSRNPARRPRSPSGHRGRRASPSSPRGRRGSPSPPRGRRASPSPPRGRRVSPSPPRARRGSPSPPRGRRLFPPGPAGFRGSSRGESRADFARDGRGDHPGDSGSRVIPPLDRDSLYTLAPSPGLPASRNSRSTGAPRPPGQSPRIEGPPPPTGSLSGARTWRFPVSPGILFCTITDSGPVRAPGREAVHHFRNRLFLSLWVRCGKVCQGEGNALQTVCLVLVQ